MALEMSEVAQVWAEVLGIPDVDMNANFFDLGGNSLLLLELISRLNERLGVDIDVLTLLELPTVAKFTSHWSAREVTTVGRSEAFVEQSSTEVTTGMARADREGAHGSG